MKQFPSAQDIDAILPQTQCGLCGYNGCMPYAEALTKGEANINLCPPGGVDGLNALGNLLNVDPAPYLAEMQDKAKPKMVAVIRETECIGCTKCITACPVDAILGSAKQMHTVIESECTGCELCVTPCPVDCIDMIAIVDNKSVEEKQQQANHYRQRYMAHLQRVNQKSEKPISHKISGAPQQDISQKQAYIQAALLRAKAKK